MRNPKRLSQTSRFDQRSVDTLPVRPVSAIQLYPSVVLYGRSSTGKTTLAATFPKPLLLLDVRDRGTQSIADVKEVEVMDVGAFNDYEMAYWYIKQHPKRYRTVVTDTVSQLQQLVVKEKSGGDARAGDWGSMTKRDWGDVSALMKEWLVNYRDLTDLGINIVFIAQDRVFNFDEEEQEGDSQIMPEVGPALSPSIAKVLNASVSIIGNTFIRERIITREGKKERRKIDYCLRVGPNPVYVTKIRKPRSVTPPSFLTDPTYEDIMEIVKGESYAQAQVERVQDPQPRGRRSENGSARRPVPVQNSGRRAGRGG